MNNLALTTINAATIAQEKTHTAGDGMGFIALLANYRPADTNQLATNTTFLNLNYLFDSDKLRYINDNIIVNGEEQPTANSVGVVLYNPQGEPSNLAIYPLNESEPFLLHPFNNDGFIIGTGGELVAMPSIDSLAEIYIHTSEEQKYTFLVPFQPYQFDSLVKGYAKHTQVTLFTMLANVPALSKTFKTDNIKLVATVDTIEDMLMEYSIDEILALPDTQIMTLGGLDWGTPEPLDGDYIPATRYPMEAWTGVLGDAVRAIAHHAQVPDAMAGQCILGALSTIGQRYINAPIGHDYKPVSLFLITEGGSGAGKTFASGLSHYSINQWDKRTDQAYIALLEEWQTELDSLKGKERREYIQNSPKPINGSVVIQEGTIEAILDKFVLDGKPNLSWTTDDAGQFFNGHTMKSDTAGSAIASLAKLWDGAPVNRVRSQRGINPQYKTNAYDVRLTLDLQGQRVILEPALTDPLLVEQGFLARALLACPDSLQGKRVWNTPERMNNNPHDDPRLQAYWARCDILLDPPPGEINRDSNGKETRLNMPFADAHARQLLADYQQSVEERQAKGKPLEYFKAFASRMAQNASRIAALMAFFDCQKAISTEYLKRAFLLVEYSTAERLRYLDIKPAGENDSQKLMNWLVAKAKEKNTDKLNWSFIYHGCPKPMNKNSKYIKSVIEILESGNHVRMEKEGRAVLVFINPALLP